MEGKDKKLQAKAFGDYAEEMTAELYIRNGYTIVERNWRLGKTEIDLIAQKDNTLVLIEVKARGSAEEDAMAAVTHDKRKRMIRAADTYIRRYPGDMSYRFDIVACTGKIGQIEISVLEDAFVAAEIF